MPVPGWYKPLGGTGLHVVPLGSALSSVCLSVCGSPVPCARSSLSPCCSHWHGKQEREKMLSGGSAQGHKEGTGAVALCVAANSTRGPPEPFHCPRCQTADSPQCQGMGGFIREGQARGSVGQDSRVRGWWHSFSGPSVHPMAGDPLGLGEIVGLARQTLGAQRLHGPALPLLPNCEQQQCSAGQKHLLLILFPENALEP